MVRHSAGMPLWKSSLGNVRGGTLWVMSQFTRLTAIAMAGNRTTNPTTINWAGVPPATAA